MAAEDELNVALGLEEAPPKFNYSNFESDVGRECVVEDESESAVGRDSDCVIVGMFEKASLNKPSTSLIEKKGFFEFDGKFGDEYAPMNDPKKSECVGDDKDVEVNDPKKSEDVKLNDPKKEVCDVDTEVVELKEPKKENCDVDTEHVNFTDPKKEDFDGDKKQVDFEKQQESGRITGALIAAEFEMKLKIGTEFPDLEKVYLLYCEYARAKGFSVRKGEQRYFGKSPTIRWKEFICSCTGLPSYRSAKHKVAVYQKLVTHSDCKARLIVSRNDMGPFAVFFFNKEHNHVLVDCDQSFLLRSSRNMSYAKKSVLEALNSAGIGVTKAFNFMSKESGGIQNVGFTKKDAYHHMDRVRLETKVEDGDARLLLEYFSEKSAADAFFFFKYQLDDDGRLMNIFFRDNRCGLDYDAFGDVLSVDTTYRTNKYNLICCPFVGINHHTRNVMFGMAMLSDETTATFKWLFETFLQSMHGKQPKCIFTDQCRAMMNAIDVVFPNSKHRLCQWHIMKNCASNFGKLHGDSTFRSLWHKCMNIVESEEDFETTWKEMMENYPISNRSWFDGMHRIRERWASCFSRGTFTAGLLATSRSELTNKVLKQVVHSTVALSTFVKQYEGILVSWRTTERTEDTFSIWNPGRAVSNSALLEKGARVFTRTIYKELERDYSNCQTLIIEPKAGIPISNILTQYKAKGRELCSVERKVVFNSLTRHATCDCGKWETEGLICRHILKVFAIENVDDLPESLIYRRWTKRAKELNLCPAVNVGEETAVMRHMNLTNDFMRHMSEMLSNAMQHEPLRLKLLEIMNEVHQKVSELTWNYVGSEPAVKEPPCLIVPLFRDPRKICPRGFANVRKTNLFPPKGRKRGRKSSPKSSPAKNAKVTKTSTTRTQQFMSTNEDKTEEEDPDDLCNLTL